ncbi:DUF294 nucleotidyltransferase-like domain-containing protein [Pontibacillus salicampi]|uniref:DUF294 nucleotidyltransferase-like domain-containing protein n=1 Tax=Pontibacillus salicampi TaxID=1449801 RepID=A0ABV6LTF2_9BACI
MTHHIPSSTFQVKDRVREHPLFEKVTISLFEEIYVLCEERLYSERSIIAETTKKRQGIFLLTEGTAEVCVTNDSCMEVIEIVEAGELLGLGSLYTFLQRDQTDELKSIIQVQAASEVVGLFIPYEVLTSLWQQERIKDYFLQQVVTRLKDVYVSLTEQVQLAQHFGDSEPFLRRVQDIMTTPFQSVQEGETIQQAAVKMTQHQVSSVLVMKEDTLLGIITKHDLISRVIANNRSVSDDVQTIMTPNPYTIRASEYYYQALSGLLLHGIHHYPVINEMDRVVGVVTLSDLLRKRHHQMFNAIRGIESLTTVDLPKAKKEIYAVLTIVLKDKVPSLHVLNTITKLYDRLAQHAVTLAVERIKEQGNGDPPTAFAWYQMGSAGRGEQFVLTDQDHFLVYEDVPEEKQEITKDYFKKLGEEITFLLHQAGYELCSGNMMCSEPEWRGSLQDWEQNIRSWNIRATNESLMKAQNFFSFRKVYGDDTLHNAFVEKLRASLSKSKIFLFRLTQMEKENPAPALHQPFRSLLKMNKKQIDMKKEMLFPFHHALQILCVSYGILEGTTVEKLEQLVERQVLTESEGHNLKEAFQQTMSMYMQRKWENVQAEQVSSVISLARLHTWEKDQLFQSLKMIRLFQRRLFHEYAY